MFYSGGETDMFSHDYLEPPRQSIPAPSSSDCDICCQSPEDLDGGTIGLDCGHCYCSSCWSRYLTDKIVEQGASGSSVQCPGHGCAAVVEDRMVEKVVTDPAVVDKYWLLVTNIFVEQHWQSPAGVRHGCEGGGAAGSLCGVPVWPGLLLQVRQGGARPSAVSSHGQVSLDDVILSQWFDLNSPGGRSVS